MVCVGQSDHTKRNHRHGRAVLRLLHNIVPESSHCATHEMVVREEIVLLQTE